MLPRDDNKGGLAMKKQRKRDFPVDEVRRYLEPGPVVLVSSAWKGRRNIMTMGWHTVMEFTPALVGCVIAESNYSFHLIRGSGECVINIPDAAMLDAVARIGNCDGDAVDKFASFNLTPAKAAKVRAPLIAECFANLECRLHDARLVKDYNFFIFEVVKAHVASKPRFPKTLHYRGQGVFTQDDGRPHSRVRLFKKLREEGNF
jgi:flavin reductase (DIM6/NTAB) family NADH-FMN oxidoreductase RutF